ncbi:MAG TPA: aldo/keto reductase, partial [Vicinamibacterales bacterium]
AAIGGYDYGRVDDEQSIAAIHRALDAGINFFDVADVYGLGHAERVLAKALGPRRNQVVIATKGGVAFDDSGNTRLDISPRHLRSAVEASLRRLGVDCIALYQIHKPDGVTPVRDAVGELVRCQEEGKIRHLGCTRFSIADLDDGLSRGRLESNQLAFSLLEQETAATIEYGWREQGMSGITFNSLGQGLLSGKYDRQARFSGTDLRRRSELFTREAVERGLAVVQRLREVGAGHARTPAQTALRWVLEHEAVTCVLAGLKTSAQVDENVGAADWKLDPADMAALSKAARAESVC